jgi:SprA-related family
MTDQVTTIGLVPFAGRSLPGATQRSPEPAAVPEPRKPERNEAAAKPADPATAVPTPPLAGETQIAAQQDPSGAKAKTGDPPSSAGGRQPGDLTDEEKKKVQALQERDRAVRAHEAAHKLAGGSYAGQVSFTTVKGPDGQSYAIGGEVPIDTSPVPNNPDATISKLETVIRAALAPSDPSAQDRQVAAEAQAEIQKAREQKQQNQEKELEKSKEAGGKAGPGSGANSGTHDAGPAGSASASPAVRGSASRDTTLSPGTLFNLVA